MTGNRDSKQLETRHAEEKIKKTCPIFSNHDPITEKMLVLCIAKAVFIIIIIIIIIINTYSCEFFTPTFADSLSLESE